LGTIRDLVQYNAATGTTTVVNHVRYDTFGQIVSQTNSQFQPWFAYTGREWDPAVGLYVYRARWYDPRAGRFLSEDPLGFAAGDVNLNRYVGNGATLWVDPSGMILVQYSPSDTPQREPSGLSHGAREVLGGLLEAGAGALVLSGSVLAEAPTLGVATVGVIGGSLLVGDGVDRVIAGFQELTTGKARDGVLDDIAKYFGGDSAAYALNELREQRELYALTMGLGMVVSRTGGPPSRRAGPTAKSARPKVKTHGHHSDPKFLGGDPNQPVTDLPVPDHQGLHKDLNNFLRGKTDTAGNHMRPQRGNSAADIQQNFTRQERLDASAEFYKKFRATYPDAARDFFKQHPHLE
ncbi:MAG: RHS repeat-associated core domain-containing protein, partial [Planctomycetaceae bacterium]